MGTLSEVICCADGDRATGAGHLVRTAAIARACQWRGAAVRLLTGAHTPLHEMAWGGLPIEVLPGSVDARVAVARARWPTARLVIDHYAATDLAGAVVLDDGLPRSTAAAALVVDPAPGRHPRDHAAPWVGGPTWAPLRAAFRPRPVDSTGPVLVALGATDAAGGLPGLVAALGAERLELLCAQDPGLGRPWHQGLDAEALAALAATCRCAVVSASTLALEMDALGVPLVAVQTADNQAGMAAGLRAAGVPVVSAGDWAGVAAAVAAGGVAAHLGDGGGAERLAERILEPRVPGLRPAAWSDAGRLLAWANDPDTRAKSFSSAAIPLADHERWLAASLASPTRRLFIGEDDGLALGTVRTDATPEGLVVSITVAPDQRGQGRGRLLLERLAAWAGPRRLVAWIRADHPASRRLFLACGYQPVRDDIVQGHPATCYHHTP